MNERILKNNIFNKFMLELYLQPPSIIEYASVLYFTPSLESFSEVHRIINNGFHPFKGFELPNELKSPSELPLEKVIDSIQYAEDKVDLILKDEESFKILYSKDSPKTTWQRKKGNCRQFSILAVAYLRNKGIPARFRSLDEDHLAMEVYLDGEWEYYEPQNLSLQRVAKPLTESEERFYNLLLMEVKSRNLRSK
jgi:hypothetical protein